MATMKERLREKYKSKLPFSKQDLAWMDKNDWHPVDERPLKKEFVQKLLKAVKGPFRRTTIKELLG